VVRGPSALLIVAAVGAALLLAAPVLPALGSGDAGLLVAGGAGLLAVAACALAVTVAIDTPAVLWLALPAAALLMGAVDAANLAGAATPAEALAYALAGVAFATVLDAPALVLALPLFVGVVDLVSVAGGAAGALQLEPSVAPGDPLGLELPAWGTTHAVGRLNPVCVLFLASYAAYARRFGLDRTATAVALTAALLAGLVWSVATDGAVPVLALLGGAFLLANVRRLRGVARAAQNGDGVGATPGRRG
jgi:hypothetical protein